MIYQLTRDYAKAWQLIQQREKIVCQYDRRNGCRDVGMCDKSIGGTIDISALGQCRYLPTVFELFVERCTELNIEFYLPLDDNMLVISKERLQEVASEVVGQALAPFDILIKSTGDIANDTTNRPD